MVFESPLRAKGLPAGKEDHLFYAEKVMIGWVSIVNQAKLVIPNGITVGEFVYNEKYGRKNFSKSRSPFTCGLTGRLYAIAEVQQRVDFLARALAKRTGWDPSENDEWNKVACIFSLNTVRKSLQNSNGVSCRN